MNFLRAVGCFRNLASKADTMPSKYCFIMVHLLNISNKRLDACALLPKERMVQSPSICSMGRPAVRSASRTPPEAGTGMDRRTSQCRLSQPLALHATARAETSSAITPVCSGLSVRAHRGRDRRPRANCVALSPDPCICMGAKPRDPVQKSSSTIRAPHDSNRSNASGSGNTLPNTYTGTPPLPLDRACRFVHWRP